MTDTIVIPQPVPIDPKTGNILFNGAGGVGFVMRFNDASGTPRDVTAVTVVIYVWGTTPFTRTLTPGATTDRKVMIFEQADAALIGVSADGKTGKPFAVVETTVDPPRTHWEGGIIVRGKAALPGG